MKVYPAGKSRHCHWLAALRAAGLPFEASWLDWARNRDGVEPSPDEWRRHSETCISEAAASDIVLLHAQADELQFGALLEAGAALGAGKQVYLVGPHPWPFLRHHPRVRSFDTLVAAIRAIKAQEAGETARVVAMRRLVL